MSAELKGEIGEYIVEDLLNKFDSNKVKYIHNMILPKSNGDITQIDFLILTPYNFIALEVKNWECIVKTSGTTLSWEIIYPSGKVFRANPETQNRSHIRTLYEHSEYPYCNKIFFTSKAKIIGHSSCIVDSLGLYSLLSSGHVRYTPQQIKDEYYKMLDIKYSCYDRWLIKSSNFSSYESIDTLVKLIRSDNE